PHGAGGVQHPPAAAAPQHRPRPGREFPTFPKFRSLRAPKFPAAPGEPIPGGRHQNHRLVLGHAAAVPAVGGAAVHPEQGAAARRLPPFPAHTRAGEPEPPDADHAPQIPAPGGRGFAVQQFADSPARGFPGAAAVAGAAARRRDPNLRPGNPLQLPRPPPPAPAPLPRQLHRRRFAAEAEGGEMLPPGFRLHEK
ncbi:unnamed protein product, partial [Coccothraustes coccothraustes]